MITRTTILKSALSVTLLASLVACEKDKPGNGPDRESSDVEFFIATDVEAAGQSSGYLLAVPDITKGTASVVGNGLEVSGYSSWVFPNEYVGIGLKYQKGDPGLGIGVGLGQKGNIVKTGADFRIDSRFTTYGAFQGQALTAVGGVKVAADAKNIYTTFNFIDPDKNNAVRTVTKNTTNLTGNGEYATLSGIVPFGKDEFLSAIVPSKLNTETGSGGSSTGLTDHPDSVWVVAFDKDLNVKRIYGDDRLGYASGRFRSQYYSTISDDGRGNVYVFSPANDVRSTKAGGVIRIKSGEQDFDQNYFLNLKSALGADSDIKFYHVYHVSGDLFVLDYRRTAETDPKQQVPVANALAVVNVATKQFTWVDGLPDFKKNPMFGNPIAENGKLYIPVSLTSGEKPAIYSVDAETAKATRGLEVDASEISAVGKLKKQ